MIVFNAGYKYGLVSNTVGDISTFEQLIISLPAGGQLIQAK